MEHVNNGQSSMDAAFDGFDQNLINSWGNTVDPMSFDQSGFSQYHDANAAFNLGFPNDAFTADFASSAYPPPSPQPAQPPQQQHQQQHQHLQHPPQKHVDAVFNTEPYGTGQAYAQAHSFPTDFYSNDMNPPARAASQQNVQHQALQRSQSQQQTDPALQLQQMSSHMSSQTPTPPPRAQQAQYPQGFPQQQQQQQQQQQHLSQMHRQSPLPQTRSQTVNMNFNQSWDATFLQPQLHPPSTGSGTPSYASTPQLPTTHASPQPTTAFVYPPPASNTRAAARPPANVPTTSSPQPPQKQPQPQLQAQLQAQQAVQRMLIQSPAPPSGTPMPSMTQSSAQPSIAPRPVQTAPAMTRSTAARTRITHPDLLQAKADPAYSKVPMAPYLVFYNAPEKLNFTGKLPKFFFKAKSEGDILPITGPKRVARRTLPKDPEALRKTVINAETPSEESEEPSSSEYESSSDEEEVDEDISTVREATRPSTVTAAARWDAITAAWLPRNRHATPTEIGTKIQLFHELVTSLRERLKHAATDLAEAERKKQTAALPKLKDARGVQRKALSAAFDAAVEHGHRDVLAHLGDNQRLVNGLMNILIDCIKSEDFGGELPRATFELMSHFTTLTDDLLKKVKFDGIQKRFTKRGSDAIKKFIAAIVASTQGKSDGGSPKPDDKAEKPVPEVGKVKIEPLKPASTLKRSFDGDSSSKPPAKKAALSVPAKATTKPAPPKTTVVQQKPTNFLQSLTRPAPKPAAPKPAPAPPPKRLDNEPAPTSSLAALLASIEKPKEVVKSTQTPDGPPETPEERKKRERKESRRHLRVKFREGDDLVQIKLFKHEVSEDEGRDSEMLRDAHDDRSEGMMHKRRVQTVGDGLDDDDDDDYNPEIEYRPYPDLMEIDYSAIPAETKDKAFVTRGGVSPVTSPQQEIQAKREAVEVMVFYPDEKDIPFSPKEPTGEDPAGEPAKEFGPPTAAWLQKRFHEIQQHGADSVLQSVRRAQDAPSAATEPRVAQQQVHGMNPTQLAWLESIVAALKDQPFPPTEPPHWMSEPAKAHWWEGYRRDNPAAKTEPALAAQFALPAQPGFDLQAQMAAAMLQQPAGFQQPDLMNALLAGTSAQEPSPDVLMKVQAALAGMNQPPSTSTAPNWNNWADSSAASDAYEPRPEPARQPEPPRHTEPARPKRGGNPNAEPLSTARGRDGAATYEQPRREHGKKSKGMCRYSSSSRCPRGKKCPYKHDRP